MNFKAYIFFVSVLLLSCNVEPNNSNRPCNQKKESREELGVYKILNETDENGDQQGMWRIYGHMKPELGFEEDHIIEEGRYQDGLKEGKWIVYYHDQRIHKEVMFSRDTMHGDTKVYDYENGYVVTTKFKKGKTIEIDTLLF